MRRGYIKFVANFKKLLTAFSFFRLRSADLEYFQYKYPSIFAVFLVVSYWVLSRTIFEIDLDAAIANATTLMGVLIGFYIAALAAVTSFPNESLNSVMAGNAPRIKERGGAEFSPITRRRFLSILLGYCAFLSIVVYILGSASASVKFAARTNEFLEVILKAIWWSGYTWLLASLLTVTMLCLHYLIDRMHRP
ncbi:hypothetical protein [Ponticoccus litoralis]|uniref:Uncharacterized protein n=1 Tax=Ponticoccus litoralis TaxID=422297 RepID=A0AAW9SMT6_9RHOB